MELIYRAMGWLMRQIYDLVSNFNPEDLAIVSNYAISLIIFSVLIKIVTIPLSMSQTKNMAKTRAIQPKIQEIQEKYVNDDLTIARKTQELYKEENVSPAGGCLPLLVQMPLIIAMFRIVREPVTYVFSDPGMYDAMNKSFLWMSNIATPDLLIAALSGLVSFLYTKMTVKNQSQAAVGNKEQQEAMESSQRMMQLVMPIMMFFIYRSLPAAIPLYITINMLVTAIQQSIVNKMTQKEVENEVN